MLSRLVHLQRPALSGRAILLRLPPRAVHHRVVARHHVQADSSVAGLGFVGLGLAVTAATTSKMSLVDFLQDSVYLVAGKMRQAYGDENRRILVQLIGANAVVFGFWNVSHRSPRLARFMWHHFACSYNGVVHERRLHTLLTSAFSHITLTHFGINMYMLWHFGSAILPPMDDASSGYVATLTNGKWFESVTRPFGYHPPRTLNATEFGALYFSSAIASSVLSAVVSGAMGSPLLYSIGASGAVFGILTSYCMLRPDQELYLYGMLPLTASDLLTVSVGVNAVGSIFQHAKQAVIAPGIDFVGHLGGQATAYVLTPK
ncbi:hypothetical protein SPRG_20100 [Saprolegnia parasitica CBS 223.65]|uniref:Peptidase S54 rhomboid domain-containing protein n=1 Tax=Saprolegnia parasitica (strain CBS 223.65) TaxID=695850 RepID=A0A067CR26_SAPPC|nr:hypothetical protein SPRG_20100 [Saprolegnia parasitica CBS 223.65]KDO28996.1 hypothetical protein SPRG_20100 [Saprolegnia parasitica CBS 223.65]|eukprot:XP_012200326.1 hypothetical protein SPRG_20100 [Saprolegnia parasitica CBS 223.65]